MHRSSCNSGSTHNTGVAVTAASTHKVEAAFLLEAEDAKVLADAGFLAAMRGDVQVADCIFLPLCQLRPGRSYPWVGRTLARFNSGRAGEAASLLEGVTSDDSEEESILRAWHGLALHLAGHRAQSVSVLSRVAATNGSGAQLARAFLGLKEPTEHRKDEVRPNHD